MVSEKSLRRWTNAELERVRKVWAVVSSRSVVELRGRICGAVVVKVSSGWICGAMERVRALMGAGAGQRASGRRRRSEVYLGCFWKL